MAGFLEKLEQMELRFRKELHQQRLELQQQRLELENRLVSVDDIKGDGLKLCPELVTFSEFQKQLEDAEKQLDGKDVDELPEKDCEKLARLRKKARILERLLNAVINETGIQGVQESLKYFIKQIKPWRIVGAHSMNLYAYSNSKKNLRPQSTLKRTKLNYKLVDAKEYYHVKAEIVEELQCWIEGGFISDTQLEKSIAAMPDFFTRVLSWYKTELLRFKH